MHTIYLVRHAAAQPDGGQDPGLSDAGRLQAEALGRRLAGEPIRTVLHSPKNRATQTAAAIAAHLPDAHVDVTDLLDDRTAVPSPERAGDYPAHRHAWLSQVPEVERDVDGRRMTHAWRLLAAEHREGATLMVTHAFVVSWVAREVLGAPPAAWLQLMPVANAGLTVIGSDRYGVRTIELFNATDHLDPQHG